MNRTTFCTCILCTLLDDYLPHRYPDVGTPIRTCLTRYEVPQHSFASLRKKHPRLPPFVPHNTLSSDVSDPVDSLSGIC